MVDTCILINTLNLLDLLDGNPSSNGIWIGPAGTLIIGDTLIVAGLSQAVYNFQYLVQGTAPCGDDVALLTIDFTTGGAQAGNDNVVDVCSNSGLYDLSAVLTPNADPGGTWNMLTGSPLCLTDSLLDISCLDSDSSYVLSYTVVEPGCGIDSAVVGLNIISAPDIGQDVSLNLCETDTVFDMFGQLNVQDSSGFWIGPLGPITTTVFDPAVSKEGDYLYIVNPPPPCPLDTAVVSIIVDDIPDAGDGGTATICTGEFFTDLTGFTNQDGSNGVWTDPDNTGALDQNGIFSADGVTPDVYLYQYIVSNTGCGSDTADVSVDVQTGIVVENITFDCDIDNWSYTVSFDILNGDPNSYTVNGVSGTVISGTPPTFESDPVPLYDLLQLTVSGGFCGDADLDIISDCDFGSLVNVPEMYSPNGDGFNDFLEIQGIEGFPDNHIEIYNRWGDLIYKADGYDNTSVFWDGLSPDALISGQAPAGTYYYVLDLGVDGASVIRGFVYLNK